MFCEKCGTEVPDDANFCHKCGASIAGERATEEARYEICQIEYETRGLAGMDFKLWASAIGPNGTYTAAKTTWKDGLFHLYCPDGGCRRCLRARDRLVQELVDDGWQPVEERGKNWWQLRFRRKVSSG